MAGDKPQSFKQTQFLNSHFILSDNYKVSTRSVYDFFQPRSYNARKSLKCQIYQGFPQKHMSAWRKSRCCCILHVCVEKELTLAKYYIKIIAQEEEANDHGHKYSTEGFIKELTIYISFIYLMAFVLLKD